jgi:PAS domain S-box-containing protein
MSADAAGSKSSPTRVPVFRTLLVTGLVVIGLNALVVSFFVVRRAEAAVMTTATGDLTSLGILVGDILTRLPVDAARPVLARLAPSLGVRFTLIGRDGGVITSAGGRVDSGQAGQPEVVTAMAGRIGTDVRADADGALRLYVAVPAADGVPLIVRSDRPYARVRAQAVAVRNATLVVTLGSGAGALVVLLVLARRFDDRLNAAERERRGAEQMFRDFVETTTEWVWAVDESFTLVYCNPALRDILGYRPDELVGRRLDTLRHPDDAESVRGQVAALAAAGRGWSGLLLRARHKDGSYRYLESAAVPILGADGSLRGYRGSDRDVTDRHQAERMKSDFVSFVSHQLRTPIAGMKWMLELIADVEDLPPDAREYLGEAEASADRLARLVNDLLDIARLESGRLMLGREPVPLDDITRSVAREMEHAAADKGITLTLDLEPATITGDPQMLRQVVTNLISNAVKYTPRSGSVRVVLDAPPGEVRWSVIDTGVGVPKSAQSRLFEKFFRADNALALETDGSGLGLALVRLIVEHSGGRVWCESEEGRGATFTFTLPATQRSV